MHDPMVEAHRVPLPWPRRTAHSDMWAAARGCRWGLLRSRRTNPENLGQPTYPWWKPRGWTLVLGGRTYGLHLLARVWHVEPGERDAFTVCDRRGPWRWHIHHWRLQACLLDGVRERRTLSGQKSAAPAPEAPEATDGE